MVTMATATDRMVHIMRLTPIHRPQAISRHRSPAISRRHPATNRHLQAIRRSPATRRRPLDRAISRRHTAISRHRRTSHSLNNRWRHRNPNTTSRLTLDSRQSWHRRRAKYMNGVNHIF